MGEREETHGKAVAKAKSRGISTTGQGGYVRHVLLCLGGDCCEGRGADDLREVEKRFNRRMAGLQKAGVYVYRTYVNCLNFCKCGPLMVVYPDGVWYHSVTAEVLDRIVEEHLVGGRVVEEYAFARNPMTGTPPAGPGGASG